jgi:hypothetical protein
VTELTREKYLNRKIVDVLIDVLVGRQKLSASILQPIQNDDENNERRELGARHCALKLIGMMAK